MPACGQFAEFRLREERLEKLERRVFVRVTLHVEIDERAELRCARRRIGRSFGARCAIASSGSAGFICE